MSDEGRMDGSRVEWSAAERVALDGLRAAPPPPDLEERVVAELVGRGLVAGGGAPGAGAPARARRGRRSRLAWAGLAAAACLAAFWIGLRLGGDGASPAVAGERYLLLLYEGPGFRAPSTPEERAAVVAAYARWAAGLRERGIEVRGEELAPGDEAERLAARAGEVVATAGAPAGAAGTLAGFYVLAAPDRDAAVAIARTTPHLARGGTVVVRRIAGP